METDALAERYYLPLAAAFVRGANPRPRAASPTTPGSFAPGSRTA